MWRFVLASLCAPAAHTTVMERRQDSSPATVPCNMTTVATVTSGIETVLFEEDQYTFHATSTVTVLALDASTPSTTPTASPQPTERAEAIATGSAKARRTPRKRTSAPPGTHRTQKPAAMEKRSASDPLCSNPTSTITITLPSSTHTSTTTHLLSRLARATTTQPACSPSRTYGLINGTLNRHFVGAYPSVHQFPNVTTEECCKKCFESEDGCVAWSFGGSVGNSIPVEGCQVAVYEGGCPRLGGMETIVYSNAEKGPVGVGRCNVLVGFFQG